ncbi:MAG: hypothetical protein IJR00_00250, partial [Lachnospiraceae bacterium]|nr:hypothetical protein [Lachnospiraceae bacterium]
HPEDTVDVVMLGSSHIHCNIDPGLLYHDYGIAAYNYSAAAQPLWNTYHYLIEFCKYQKPKLVVLDLYSPAVLKEDFQYEWLRQNLYGVRFSPNKLRMLFVSTEQEVRADYFPSFFFYHDRLGELKKEDFLFPFTKYRTLPVYKGFAPYFETRPQERPQEKVSESGGLTPKSELYLKKIIDYTKQNDIPLLLIVAPYAAPPEHEMVYNRIREIAEAEGIEYLSCNEHTDAIGLDYATDFHDLDHLNYKGAEKFTHYLAGELRRRYDLPDRRGDGRYAGWEAYYHEMREHIRENAPAE